MHTADALPTPALAARRRYAIGCEMPGSEGISGGESVGNPMGDDVSGSGTDSGAGEGTPVGSA